MVQLVLDISSAKDAALIKELLKRFKNVEVNSFLPSNSKAEMRERIEAGLKDADNGDIKPWKEVKQTLIKKIRANKK